jgi:hypothetical protein
VANPKEKAQIAKKFRRDDAKTEKSRSMEVSTTTSLFWSELGVASGG